jgi:hypothetical protein
MTQMLSRNKQLQALTVGEKLYVETTLKTYARDMRGYTPAQNRRPEWLVGREFTMSLFTAVSASNAGAIRYLICIERLV